MPNITFDQTQRRDAKEPQTTKKQLLEPARRSVFGIGWDTPRSMYGINDPDASWSFDALETIETPASSYRAPVKQEAKTPAPGLEQLPQQYDSDDIQITATKSKKRKPPHVTTGREVSGTSSDDIYGRKTGVIDLTGDDSDEEHDHTIPERQFVPRPEDDSATTRFQKRKSPSPPRTFTNGLSPIPAHPRKPPIVHRSKPPIKPHDKRRKTVSSSPAANSQASHPVFNQRRRKLSAQVLDLQIAETPTRSSTVRTLVCTSLGATTDTDETPIQDTNPNSWVPPKPSGPFIEEDDSSGGEQVVAKIRKTSSRNSLARLTHRPRNDTPTRARYEDMVKESRRMRERARERAQEDPTTRATTVISTADNTALATLFDPSGEQPFLGVPHPR